jgi:hypothetical protein
VLTDAKADTIGVMSMRVKSLVSSTSSRLKRPVRTDYAVPSSMVRGRRSCPSRMTEWLPSSFQRVLSDVAREFGLSFGVVTQSTTERS